MTLDARSFGVLVELRELLWAGLPLGAHGHQLAMADPDALRAEDGMVRLTVRLHPPQGDPGEHTCALMPESVLRDPDQARMRAQGWLEMLRTALGRSRDAEVLRLVPRVLLEVREVARAKRFGSLEALREAYGCHPHVGQWLPIPDRRTATGETVTEVTRRMLAEVLPAGGKHVQLEAVATSGEHDSWLATEIHAGAGLHAYLRQIVWEEPPGGSRSIRDVKEQQVLLLPAQAFFAPDRIEPYLRGWVLAIAQALAEVPPEWADGVMPCDLVFPEVLALARPRTAEDYRDAFLVRSRLGGLLPS